MYSTPGKSQPLSGHGFTTCFTACKPLKKSVILTSRVLHRHFWWKKVIVSYLSMNLATHSILYFSHLFFNTNLNVLKYEGFIWCYIYNWLVISIFFHNCNIHVYHSKFHVNIFLLIYYDQKTLEFNSFKMTIFTNIWSIFSWQNMQILNWKRMKHICYGLHRRQAFRLQKQNLLCCYLHEVSKFVPNFSI